MLFKESARAQAPAALAVIPVHQYISLLKHALHVHNQKNTPTQLNGPRDDLEWHLPSLDTSSAFHTDH